MNVGFVACIENNKLAPEALLLFESIRTFGGKFASAAIHSYNPRGLGPLDSETYSRLRELRVDHNEQLLSKQYRDYPIANKVLACAHAERNHSEDILVFLDSDSLLLGEPEQFIVPHDCDVAVTPVWTPGIGSEGPGDPAEILWHAMFDECAVLPSNQFVTTLLTNQRVRLYCNSGLVGARRSKGIFAHWLHCFERLCESRRVRDLLNAGSEAFDGASRRPEVFLDQAALAIAISAAKARVSWLNALYNCPLHGRKELAKRYPAQRFDLDTVIHFHYKNACHWPKFFEHFQPPLNRECDQWKWLQERLPIPPLIEDAGSQPYVEFQKTMAAWRKALQQLEEIEPARVREPVPE